VYAAQLEATPVDASTIKALQAWETKKRFYLRMNRVDDVSGALGFISVCTAVAICQLTYDGFISMEGANFPVDGRIPKSFKDSFVITSLKGVETLCSLSLIALIVARMFMVHHLRIVRFAEPPRSSPCPFIFPCSCTKGDPVCAVLADGGIADALKCRHCYVST
jgi:hypothetical protein